MYNKFISKSTTALSMVHYRQFPKMATFLFPHRCIYFHTDLFISTQVYASFHDIIFVEGDRGLPLITTMWTIVTNKHIAVIHHFFMSFLPSPTFQNSNHVTINHSNHWSFKTEPNIGWKLDDTIHECNLSNNTNGMQNCNGKRQ